MKLQINQIPEEGKHIEGEEPSAILEVEDGGLRNARPVQYSLHVGLSDGGLFATGMLSTEVELQCVGCLEWFPMQVQIDSFAVQMDLHGKETADLTPHVREDILLALPPYPHCNWDESRECPGKKRVEDSSRNDEKEPETPDTTWDVLDNLNVEPETER